MKSFVITLLTTLSLSALAAPPSTTEYTPEQRKQMAEMHSKAASCLNSNKTIQECHNEMMKSPGGQWGCPMMGTGPQPDTKTKTTK
ncbi:MAG TPA: hypothetical protein VIG33_16580 [Pseudobdellovibrionaceae bacterium]|jgi:hypothetical protein